MVPVLVVGGGLAGLACAARLHREGVPALVLEGGERVGGRVGSDVVDGFTLDRGFQVLNTAYPALRRTVRLQDLDLRLLPSGVRVRREGRLHDLPHPLASPAAPLRALTSGATGLRGKAALARYAGGVLTAGPRRLKDRPDVTAGEAWAGLPTALVRDVLVPFVSGVVLEDEMTTSRVFTDLMMRMFATGRSAVPSGGMQALPRSLAQRLPPAAVRLESPVAEVRADGVVLADGTTVEARAVVVATDPWQAPALVPALGTAPQAHGVTTYWFAAAPWRGLDGTLTVDADGSGVTNSIVITASAPSYSRDGRALVATSVLHTDGRARVDADTARRTAAVLHRAPDDDWELVAAHDVPLALPAMTAPHPLRRPAYLPAAGVWVAGDHRDTSSIQGALVSGHRVAGSVLRHLSAPSRTATRDRSTR
ncbi:FAD-dependent oxidoreductase [Nocardioides kongjuensis]|uniref:Glycine/D-amino acid oxidase-like deaminating enzyme n=1 Tax=Nocardioides kongjuensis TaxID=349522 RepID=A0A852RLW2_9ACTN|nr:FAD-dependent oxidoreductase [Nocardioides kongjuensis]NYD31608.1 glycine/D-amino acid oxidase-like deaminating enzyme [Nocardioides kongjuensis]